MRRRWFLTSLAVAALGGCVQKAPSDPVKSPLNVSSPAFADGDPLPQPYGCSTGGGSPPLSVKPKDGYGGGNEKTWAVTVTSTSYSDYYPEGRTKPETPPNWLTNWLIWNIPYGHDLPPNVPHGKTVPSLETAKQGKNDFGDYGYTLGCPFSEKRLLHFEAFTLSGTITADPNITQQDLVDRIDNSGKVIGYGQLSAVVGGK